MGSRSGKKHEISIITYVGSLKRIRTEETVGNITVIRTEYKQQKQKKRRKKKPIDFDIILQ